MCRDDGPEELATMTEASAEEDEPEVLATTTEASIEKAEDTTRPSVRLRWWRRRCNYRLKVFMTMTYGPAGSAMMAEALAEDEEYMTHLRD